MNWKWWVAVQVVILASVAELVLPFSEFFFLSIVYRLEKKVFWAYIGYDAISYIRAFLNGGTVLNLDPSTYQNTIKSYFPSHPTQTGQAVNPFIGLAIGAAILIGGGTALVLTAYFLYVKPIRFLVTLRRRILREVLHLP